MIKKYFNIRIAGRYNKDKINDISEELRDVQNKGKFQNIELSMGDFSVSDFPNLANFADSLKGLGIRKKIFAAADLNIAGTALLTVTSASGRKIPAYRKISFSVLEDVSTMTQQEIDELIQNYVLILSPLENENFTKNDIVDYIRNGKVITGKEAIALGITSPARGSMKNKGKLALSQKTASQPAISQPAISQPATDAN